MKKLFFVFFLSVSCALGQKQFSPSNAHSHNDYLQVSPLFLAHSQGFGSVEADIFLRNDTLFVAHEYKEIEPERTFGKLYLKPVSDVSQKNGGSIYKDSSKQLQLLIDLKTGYANTLPALVKELQPFENLLYPKGNVKIVISGSTPPANEFKNYPDFIFYDGRPGIQYTREQLERVGLISQSFKNYSSWNGKGVPVEKDRNKIETVIEQAHKMGKPIRFWATPDLSNAWKVLMNMGVDFINTDKVEELGIYLKNRKANEYLNTSFHTVYQPTYLNNDSFKKVKNIILLIGDGMGLTQIQAGVTANKGVLNLSKMLNTGFATTEASDTYITDSAAGGTAIATGKKTHNRGIGVDSADVPQISIATHLRKKGLKTALISSGDITDATPAAFYAHQPDRSMSREIAQDFLNSPSDILIGGNEKAFSIHSEELKSKGFGFSTTWSDLKTMKAPFVLLNDSKTSSIQNGRGDFLAEAFHKAVYELKNNPKGFFIMAEGAQIDYGGHATNLPYVITEMLDFDKLVGEALKFADSNGETLVIVTADHETGGLTLLDGSTKNGYVDANFSTSDHTGVMVPVFAYGPHSLNFRGMYKNTDIHAKLLRIIK